MTFRTTRPHATALALLASLAVPLSSCSSATDRSQSNGASIVADSRLPLASASTAAAIVAIVKRYYSAAAVENGHAACALMFSPLVEDVPEDHGQASAGPHTPRGRTCAGVMTQLFARRHHFLAHENTTLSVVAVHANDKKGYAILRFGSASQSRFIDTHIEFGAWTINSMFDSARP